MVALFTGAWIETLCTYHYTRLDIWSRSLRARGLKLALSPLILPDYKVALFTGAWIETSSIVLDTFLAKVALFTGAWIETYSFIML